jgi:hypothetical protein
MDDRNKNHKIQIYLINLNILIKLKTIFIYTVTYNEDGLNFKEKEPHF